jgi:hypothetical protein
MPSLTSIALNAYTRLFSDIKARIACAEDWWFSDILAYRRTKSGYSKTAKSAVCGRPFVSMTLREGNCHAPESRFCRSLSSCQGRSKREPVWRSKSSPVEVRSAANGKAGLLGVGGGAFSLALLEAEAVAVHLQDVDVVGEAIEQRTS